jgi:hypothetical protein
MARKKLDADTPPYDPEENPPEDTDLEEPEKGESGGKSFADLSSEQEGQAQEATQDLATAVEKRIGTALDWEEQLARWIDSPGAHSYPTRWAAVLKKRKAGEAATKVVKALGELKSALDASVMAFDAEQEDAQQKFK